MTPATSLATPGSAATTSCRTLAAADSDGASGWDSSDDGEEEEEVTFIPISLGTAEASMPEYLKVGGSSSIGGCRVGPVGLGLPHKRHNDV